MPGVGRIYREKQESVICSYILPQTIDSRFTACYNWHSIEFQNSNLFGGSHAYCFDSLSGYDRHGLLFGLEPTTHELSRAGNQEAGRAQCARGESTEGATAPRPGSR